MRSLKHNSAVWLLYLIFFLVDLTCSGDGHDLENNTNNNTNSSSACSERCLNYLSRYNGSTVTTSTPSYSTSTLPSTTETTPGENKTAGDREQNNQTGCRIKPEDVDTTSECLEWQRAHWTRYNVSSIVMSRTNKLQQLGKYLLYKGWVIIFSCLCKWKFVD